MIAHSLHGRPDVLAPTIGLRRPAFNTAAGRAILGQPKLLLVDEPTEGLAPSIVMHLRDVFKELSKKTALVIVEQNLPLVCAIADKVYALKEGHIMAELTDRASIKPEACEKYL